MTTPGSLFEMELPLPDSSLTSAASRLIGFPIRYSELQRDLRVLLLPEEVAKWSREFYGKRLTLCDVLAERYPLVIFHGDVGTGKTAMAEAISNELVRDLGKPAMLFKLSTRVRGVGHVGQMSALINQAFDVVSKEAGKAKMSFLIIDEADSLVTNREAEQSHHEDKVAVNTLIQRIDDLRRYGGRILVFLCTNRFRALDPAIVRRAGRIVRFDRPSETEREELLRVDCEGLGLSADGISQLVHLTGPHLEKGQPGFTFSDLRTRLLPEALLRAFPTRKVELSDLIAVAKNMAPSPVLEG